MIQTFTCPNSRHGLPQYRKVSEPSAVLGGRTARCPACEQVVTLKFLDARDGAPQSYYYADHTVDDIA